MGYGERGLWSIHDRSSLVLLCSHCFSDPVWVLSMDCREISAWSTFFPPFSLTLMSAVLFLILVFLFCHPPCAFFFCPKCTFPETVPCWLRGSAAPCGGSAGAAGISWVQLRTAPASLIKVPLQPLHLHPAE